MAKKIAELWLKNVYPLPINGHERLILSNYRVIGWNKIYMIDTRDLHILASVSENTKVTLGGNSISKVFWKNVKDDTFLVIEFKGGMTNFVHFQNFSGIKFRSLRDNTL